METDKSKGDSMDRFSRTERLLGKESLKKLNDSKVAVFGIGGVGSFVVEGLVRSGVGKLVLVDKDTIAKSNLNRQLHATMETIGRAKVEVMKERILAINENAEVTAIEKFYLPEVAEDFFQENYDYVVDAIDTVAGKIDLVVQCKSRNIPIISSMGAGNKLDPTKFEVTDIYKTNICPLAKVMRKELRKREIPSLKVVYSQEPAITPFETEEFDLYRRQIPGSVAFVPSVAGLIIAGEVVKDLVR